MNKPFLMLLLCVAVTACAGAQDSSVRVLDNVEDNASADWSKLRGYAGVDKKPPPPRKETAQPRYCYHLYQDIVCYGKPVPGQENRLVAYQDSSAHTGYVMEETASPKAVLKPLPSVTVPTPPKIAAVPAPKPEKVLKEIIFDPSELQPKDLVPQKTQ